MSFGYADMFWHNQEYEKLKPWGPPPELGISVGSRA